MRAAPMQLCNPDKTGLQYLLEFEFIEAITCTYAGAAGFAVTALVVYTAVAGSIYIRTGSMILPLGILMMAGGAILTQMAPVATQFAVVLLLVLPAGLFAYLYQKHAR